MSHPQPPTFLITGATGSQGGAVARALLAAHQNVHVLARDPSSAAAQALAAAGAKIFKGDFADASAIQLAAAHCTGVFINVSPTADPSAELTHAQTIISACRAAGVNKCVYTSVINAGKHATFRSSNPDGTSTPFNAATTFRASYWLTKAAIQDAVTSAGFASWTILQPAFLVQNLVPPVSRYLFQRLASDHVLYTAYKPDTQIAITDPADIGTFAAKAFLSEGREMEGRIVPVACLETPTIGEIAWAMSEVSGREVGTEFLSEDEFQERRGRELLVASQGWARDGWLDVDVQQVRAEGVDVGTLKAFLEREGEALARAFDD